MIEDKVQIVEVIQNWAFWRDQAEWDKLATTFHPDGVIELSWFNGPFTRFIEASRAMRKQSAMTKHEIGGSSIEVRGSRAIAQTQVRILARTQVHGVECDATALGRFYDFLERRDRWAICRRVALYEKDRLDPVMPGTAIPFDAARLASIPQPYRFLGYLLALSGHPVVSALPTDDSPAQRALVSEGEAWLRVPTTSHVK